jgi:hypothetical protein
METNKERREPRRLGERSTRLPSLGRWAGPTFQALEDPAGHCAAYWECPDFSSEQPHSLLGRSTFRFRRPLRGLLCRVQARRAEGIGNLWGLPCSPSCTRPGLRVAIEARRADGIEPRAPARGTPASPPPPSPRRGRRKVGGAVSRARGPVARFRRNRAAGFRRKPATPPCSPGISGRPRSTRAGS